MKGKMLIAAVLAASVTMSACQKNEDSSTTLPSSRQVSEISDKDIIGNPDFTNPICDEIYKSLDTTDPWVTDISGVYRPLPEIDEDTAPIDVSSVNKFPMKKILLNQDMIFEFVANTSVDIGDEVTLYLFDRNPQYAWNKEDAFLMITCTKETLEDGTVIYKGTGKVEKEATPGIYTIVITHGDDVVDLMYDIFAEQEFTIIPIDMPEETKTDVTAYKPVIYLYPEKPSEIDVTIDLDGQIECTYPLYDPVEGWRVIADPDGVLHIDGKEYDYLFWDGMIDMDFDPMTNAICVRGCDTAKFLEEYLTAAGLNSSEIDDFISFWLPKMEKNEYNVISFPTAEYEEKAELNVSPAPDTVIRVYMVFEGSDKPVDIPSENQLVMPEDVTREGFTLVEWGGSQLDE